MIMIVNELCRQATQE